MKGALSPDAGDATDGTGRPHIMQITHDLGVGGLPRVVVTLAKTLDRDRFRVSVLCLNEGGPLSEELEEDGIPVHVLDGTSRIDRYLAFRRVAAVLRREDVDVIHTHNTQPFMDGGLGGLLAGVETHVHTDHARDFPDKRRYMFAEHVLSRFTYRVVGVSEHTSRNLVEYEKIDPGRISTIHNGIDSAPFEGSVDVEEKRREVGLPVDAPVVGVGVRFTEQKGLVHLIRAFPEVRRTIPEAILALAGYGPLEDELRREAESLGLDGAVRFLGRRMDMPELYRAFDVYALPSNWEGLPLVLLEAMAAECPIVASRVGGVPAAVEDGHNGLLVEPRRPEQLASALIELLRDPRRRRDMGRAGREMFDRRFSADAMTRAYESLYLREN